MRRIGLAAAVVLGLGGAAPAGAATSGPYGGHPPAGAVAADNVLQVPAHPHGFVMLIHGGGWVFVGPKTLERADAPWFTAQGWGTYDIDYRGGWDSLADVTAAYDHLRKLVGRRVAICVQGESAGGTLAMLLAAARPSAACVISEAAIADITTMPSQFRANVNTFVFPGHLWAFSPVREAHLIRSPLLMAGSDRDQIVPEARQLGEMKSARPRTLTMLLRGAPGPGPSNFMHGSVTVRALERFRTAMRKMLAAAARFRP